MHNKKINRRVFSKLAGCGMINLTMLGIISPNYISASNQQNLEEKIIQKDKKFEETTWKEIDAGLHLGEISSKVKSDYGDSKITILKINPEYYNFDLIISKENGEKNKTAKEWAEARGLPAVINAGMYQSDLKTNIGFMKNYDFINNKNINRDNAILAFNRKDKTVPQIQIIDRKCQGWEDLIEKYNSLSQGIRMVDCNQKNRWSPQNKKWSTSTIALDKSGNALFIFSRSPYSMHDFTNTIINSSLDVHNMMYLEGGPEASFYLNHKGIEVKKVGSYETNFNENDDNNFFWTIPNVIGITKKS